jgi:hypothetical protein
LKPPPITQDRRQPGCWRPAERRMVATADVA